MLPLNPDTSIFMLNINRLNFKIKTKILNLKSKVNK